MKPINRMLPGAYDKAHLSRQCATGPAPVSTPTGAPVPSKPQCSVGLEWGWGGAAKTSEPAGKAAAKVAQGTGGTVGRPASTGRGKGVKLGLLLSVDEVAKCQRLRGKGTVQEWIRGLIGRAEG